MSMPQFWNDLAHRVTTLPLLRPPEIDILLKTGSSSLESLMVKGKTAINFTMCNMSHVVLCVVLAPP